MAILEGVTPFSLAVATTFLPLSVRLHIQQNMITLAIRGLSYPSWNQSPIERPCKTTAVRLEVEENQLVSVFGEIGILFDGLKGA
jgi:hypothetical protein